ncbi:unnamed protein product [Anisakis simplex]|uniref:Uncharacterized protein n=1 Tax=Anisakis simplex TaxID=6269 RepID=A0A3P6NU39_ANISI|nr:unnamed protein product [Anisakis simplex]
MISSYQHSPPRTRRSIEPAVPRHRDQYILRVILSTIPLQPHPSTLNPLNSNLSPLHRVLMKMTMLIAMITMLALIIIMIAATN